MSTWTKEQQQAISSRKQSILVAAGAGAGKTAVLVERILQRIMDPVKPVDVDRLLVVTFTNAAAAEMRERIGHSLAAALAKNPDDERLSRQLTLLGRASIATLHSFCLDLLRQHFYRLNLDPAFRVADVTEAALLKADVLEKLFEEYYQTGDEEFLFLVDAYGGAHDDNRLQEIVLQLDEYAQSHPEPLEWLTTLPTSLTEPAQVADWLAELSEAALLKLSAARMALANAVQAASEDDGPAHYLPLLEEELDQLDHVLAQLATRAPWDDLRAGLAAVSFGRLPSKKGGDETLRTRAKEERDAAKKAISGLQAKLFAQSEEQLRIGVATVAPFMLKLCTVTREFRERYHQAKSLKGLVDFSDLEHLTLRILSPDRDTDTPSAVAQELGQHFAEILVDEYQDINGVQERILQHLAGPGKANLFMVGDVKQSIYRFRLADPTLFLAKYATFSSGDGSNQRIDLAANFRSRSSVLQAVNFLFRQLMTPHIGEIVYDEAAELKALAEYPPEEGTLPPEVDVWLVERSPEAEDETKEEENEDEIGELDATTREARLIGYEIRRLIKEGRHVVWDKDQKKYRPLAYRDIVILLRATRDKANTYLDELRQLDIPAYAELGTGYFQATEVQTMLSLLRIIDNPEQDIPLAAVLRSPLCGMSGTELASIRLAAPQGSFHQAAAIASQAAEGDLALRLSDFFASLANWRQQARQGGLAELIWQIYRDTDYYNIVGAMPGGAQRQANLRALHDRARQYEATSFRGLFRFLRFVERLQEGQGDLGTARALGEKEDVVRLMSVHKSKGLEFPVVFVASLGSRFNLRDLSRDLLLHKDLGLGPNAVDLELRYKYPTLPRLVIERRLEQETLSEELRVLYVALTRAREKLYLVGSQQNVDKKLAKWQQAAQSLRSNGWALPDSLLASARCYLDWLGPALVGHQDTQALTGTPVGVPRDIEQDASRWRLTCIKTLPGGDPEAAEQGGDELAKVAKAEPLPSSGFTAEVTERLGWAYPYRHLRGKHSKVSVSELKRRLQPPDEETARPAGSWIKPTPTRPAFVQQETGLSSTELGTAIHLLLQHLDFSAPSELRVLEALRTRLVEQALLTAEEAASINLSLVAALLQGSVGNRLRQAERVWRELPFSLAVPGEMLYGPDCCEEVVFIQGVIDCVFQEGDGLVLLDFKSDAVHQGNIAQVASRYSLQVDLYTQALSSLLLLPVKERYLYFLRISQAWLV